MSAIDTRCPVCGGQHTNDPAPSFGDVLGPCKSAWMDEVDQFADAMRNQYDAQEDDTQEDRAPSIHEALEALDPRDSEASLAMYAWLTRHQRLIKVGTLDGVGHLLAYQEPKGTTRAGYVAGGTQGERIVDAAVEQAKASGATPVRRGMCARCLSIVREEADGNIVLDDGADDGTCEHLLQ